MSPYIIVIVIVFVLAVIFIPKGSSDADLFDDDWD